MFTNLFSNKKTKLANRCKQYLDIGPPENMSDYVPESLTEIIISHGAQQENLNDELKEIGSIILMETTDFNEIEDPLIRKYMITGVELVKEILQN